MSDDESDKKESPRKLIKRESIIFEVVKKNKAEQIRQRLAKKVGADFLENVSLFFEKGQKAKLSGDQVN